MPPSDSPENHAGRWRFAAVLFDERSLSLSLRGESVKVPRKSLEVLRELLRHAGEVVTKDELAEACWPRRILSETVLTATMSRLRQALDDGEQKIIQTVHGYGYKIAVPVTYDGPAAVSTSQIDIRAGDHPPGRPEWVLDRNIGRGGQGEIWLARNSQGENRVFKFALDALTLAALKREVTISRLLRQVLGARDDLVIVLGWSLDSSPPFIETEYAGEGSLDAWTARQGGLAALPLELRVELIAQCAEIVAAAHSVGVLHKDLKPSNVLIDIASGTPQVRLGDFGSGRVFDRSHLDRLDITRAGFTMSIAEGVSPSGTLLYMAPEVLVGQSPTTRSDVYALGLMLYQVVIGDFKHPLSADWEAFVADPLLREDIAAAAAGDPMLRLEDAGILAKRLRTLPQRRAQREAALREREHAAELERRLRRFRQRRPWVAALIGVLGVGLTSTLYFYKNLREAQVHTEAALQESVRNGRIASAVNEFLRDDLLGAANPLDSGRHDLTMKQVLDTAVKRIDGRFPGDPLTEGSVRRTLGFSLNGTYDYPAGEVQLRKALALLEPLGKAAEWEVVAARLDLASSLRVQNRYAEAAEQMKLALGVPPHDEVTRRLNFETRLEEVSLLMLTGETSKALTKIEACLKELDLIAGSDDRLRLLALSNYNWVLGELERSEESAKITRQTLALSEKIYGSSHPLTSDERRWLAQILDDLGRGAEAIPLFERAEKDFASALGPDNPEAYRTRMMMATAISNQGDPARAYKILREMHAQMSLRFGRDNRYTLESLGQIVGVLRKQERWAENEAVLRELISGLERIQEPGYFEIGTYSGYLAETLARQKKWGEARTWETRARQAMGTALAADDPQRAKIEKLMQEALATAPAAASSP